MEGCGAMSPHISITLGNPGSSATPQPWRPLARAGKL